MWIAPPISVEELFINLPLIVPIDEVEAFSPTLAIAPPEPPVTVLPIKSPEIVSITALPPLFAKLNIAPPNPSLVATIELPTKFPEIVPIVANAFSPFALLAIAPPYIY